MRCVIGLDQDCNALCHWHDPLLQRFGCFLFNAACVMQMPRCFVRSQCFGWFPCFQSLQVQQTARSPRHGCSLHLKISSAAVLAEHAEGRRAMPAVLRPEEPSICGNGACTGTHFRVESTPCKVFRMTAVVDACIEDYICTTCGHCHPFDGSEEFLLRKATVKSASLGTFELCFEWTLLMDTFDDLVNGVHWASRWAKLMKRFTDQGVPDATLAAMQLAYPHFRCVPCSCVQCTVWWPCPISYHLAQKLCRMNALAIVTAHLVSCLAPPLSYA